MGYAENPRATRPNADVSSLATPSLRDRQKNATMKEKKQEAQSCDIFTLEDSLGIIPWAEGSVVWAYCYGLVKS